MAICLRMATTSDITTAGLRKGKFLIDNNLLSQLDDLREVRNETIEIHFARAEAHEEEDGSHELHHFEDVDAGAFGVGHAGGAPGVQERLEGGLPLVELHAEADAGGLD